MHLLMLLKRNLTRVMSYMRRNVKRNVKKEWQKINPELLQYSKIAKWLFS